MLTLATWNVNSIRTRLDHLHRWLQANPVDILCLQETKVTDEQFPQAELEALGYYCYFSGQKSYNGVAILSRSPLTAVSAGFSPVLGADRVGSFDEQKRVITGKLGNLRILNLYVPNGSSLDSDKYPYKLEWLQLLREYVAQVLAQDPELHICGDFNIAPENRDLHHDQDEEQRVGTTSAEREALKQVLNLGFRDVFRKFNQQSEQYSWWDYRSGAFAQNKGWRIDHHYLSLAAYDRATACYIDKNPRSWDKPSDHVPVVLTITA